ncbi:phosphoglycerate mutase,2,3-bisphosphoglycerate-independent [Wolbachia endosymbiont of Armadillidium vulgare str. wVulC]|uniref:2,3-bisphosphoglycerate-independent phosphoglycerate mutase n=1 Tax=Wolbachia endosymbiont of Armadillidium arcangelii TaxID=3158571 RepID=A0AAU7Q2I2_9RICK|nr:2,3-bisphosphoglycerate-independent phosphoglycerate mutase [Wolbachia endosymbiont of Armadillidium vulgare]KLT23291.1 phosphoglycerate mutase,2,3-bisphosphoglycerate-independent [Wolbachia endosymbiont of Armadillidium vulgare str. wVulC]OJH30546.1 2,3-bisphosphoglycerate-independent phosphoglycerate mutase [Armadillidium vulgare] [Wolbachia endosymbiont of Armadillidium vulgare]OJH30871.1 2,3-bisphosphoglycerate-independent phosphoglycerate mutase [Wolbachia endosymbiont of Armadillidium v
MNFKSVVLCILDGWGNGIESSKYNAISNANPPCWQYISSNYPKCSLSTCGTDVGLPEGQIGNSEVGHMNIGSGRVVMQSLQRINQEIETIENNVNLKNFIDDLKSKNGICHIMGLVSDGGVHSHQKHISALANKISQRGIKVVIHAFLDGRDTLPNSGKKCIQEFAESIKDNDIRIATVSGRYYAMDRDNRWERTIEAYEAITFAKAPRHDDVVLLIDENYQNNITDEFIRPAVIGDYQGIQPEDGLLLANFRADRMIQLASILLNKTDYIKSSVIPVLDTGIQKEENIWIPASRAGMTPTSAANLSLKQWSCEKFTEVAKFSSILSMMQYKADLKIPYLFPPESFANTLGQVIADNKLWQLRIAETEKYAHVTFFFNCGREEPFSGEERILIPSPKVKTYDLQPKMSAFELTEELVKKIHSQEFSLIVVNYANPDMVGHTGNIKAAEQAVLAVDDCLARVLSAAEEVGNTALIITADHGNVECMFDEENNTLHTAHTLNKVPFVVSCENLKLRDGRLSDIAPTILQLLGLKKPNEMAGSSLIV